MTQADRAALRIAIIGGGFSGIAAAVALQRSGFSGFTILEKADGPGGTWRHNRYPGVEVDSPSHIYSFSFLRHDWSRTYADRDELLGYLERTVDELRLRPHFRFGTEVTALRWQEQRFCYQVETTRGVLEFDVVISAVGFLSVPRVPQWAYSSAFHGSIVHSAQWPDGLDVRDKRVGVVGTGSSAVQIVASLAPLAKSLTVFQREPNWVLPKGGRLFDAAERQRLARPLRYAWRRFGHFLTYERNRLGGRQERPGTRANLRKREQALVHMRDGLTGRPELIDQVTPSHPYQGKRPVVSDTYYPALARSNVIVAPEGIELSSRGLIDRKGTEHPLDVLVLATGFTASSYLSGLSVRGREGRDLHEQWAGEPDAFLGLQVPGFPNFFMLYGPNTNTGPLVFMLERQASYIVALLTKMRKRRAAAVDVRPSWHRSFNAYLQKRLRRTAWAATDGYHRSSSGKVVSQWPFTVTWYAALTALLPSWSNRFLPRESQP